MASPTPPPLPRFATEVTAQQEQEDTERRDADDPKDWILYVEHSQNIGWAKSCTFKPNGKSGPAPTNSIVYRRSDSRYPSSSCTSPTNSTAALESGVSRQLTFGAKRRT